ncbi:serine hydrolase domain-containing protein [Nonlabens ulvanivorans]|uniref:serine hydrolase domain-containing protein n=1 Tax=Nonlabens ulvanivorans TaxID=906888 RepID=UPI002943BA8A|nr:serine hydrolase domain-containing protein [Nonlabens ulvanivorans]WOI23914.1 serine hydrolase domain-containing protein [Nonlabens ulvanivorans]
MKVSLSIFLLSIFIVTSCSSNDNNDDDIIMDPIEINYFPPLTGDTWETTSPTDLQWDNQKLTELNTFLEQNETRAFIILVDGKIVVEEYWNNDLLGQPFDSNSTWYWASAGKSLASTVVGIAQEEGYLNINDKTSDYLGNGWTNMSQDKEDLITIKNHLTFTTGIDYNVTDEQCYDPTCLNYLVDAGNEWYYHNGTYLITHDILEAATGVTNNQYTNSSILSKTGMTGQWTNTALFTNVFFSNARSAARFGLLTLAEGNWDGTTVLGDSTYFNAMTNTSQNINEAYGYLWWLNGKSTLRFPGSTATIPSSLTPSGPVDMISALGKNGQFIDVVPSLNMVVIRMGNEPSGSLVPVILHDEMWEKIVETIN